jgi:hypothetical protein
MVDYHTVISDAVSALPSKTYEARRALYERARTALQTTLRNPALPEAELAKEHSALEAAIRKVEMELLFSEIRRDQEEYVALSVHKKLILTAKQFERSVRDSFNNNIKNMRDRLRANGRTRLGNSVPYIAPFVKMTQFTARPLFGKIRSKLPHHDPPRT